MRNIIIGLLMLISLTTTAQFGQRVEGGSVTWAGVTLHEGDTLHFGRGTLDNGQFRFLFFNDGKHWDGSNFTLRINKFEIWDSPRLGERHYILFKWPLVGAHVSDLEGAINSGEITALNSIPFTPSKVVNSVADELIKLKKLLDTGVLTQQEFDDQKKKLLKQ